MCQSAWAGPLPAKPLPIFLKKGNSMVKPHHFAKPASFLCKKTGIHPLLNFPLCISALTSIDILNITAQNKSVFNLLLHFLTSKKCI